MGETQPVFAFSLFFPSATVLAVLQVFRPPSALAEAVT